jgi:uncharacterized protein YndB with AHSA1/START domain
VTTTPPVITMTRIISAPPDAVFRAWLEPELLQRWLAPQPCQVKDVQVDARTGGHYAIVVADPEGNVHKTTGEYLEIIPGRRLVKTWTYEGPLAFDRTPSIVTVELREVRQGVTELRLTHSQIQDEEGRAGAGAGWVLCLDKLEEILTTRRTV